MIKVGYDNIIPTNLDYRTAFFVLLAVFVVSGAAAGMLFDRTITNYLYLHTPVKPPVAEYAYLDPMHYDNDIMIPPPLAYERHVHTLDDFAVWRGMLADRDLHIRNNPHPEPVILESSPGLEKFLLGDIMVWHASPSSPNGKAVLVVPGSGDGAAREIMGIRTEHTPYHEEIGLRLSALGYDAYTLELEGWGQRQKDVGSTCPIASIPINCEYFAFREKLARYGISLTSMHDREVVTVLSYMESKHDWIAVSGLSMGVGRALTAALANPDTVDAVALASGISMIHGWPIFVTTGPLIEAEYDVENVDRVRALAPIPLYMSYGALESGSFGYAAKSGDIRDAIQPIYEMHGAADAFTYIVHDGMHEYDVDSVIAFLDSH